MKRMRIPLLIALGVAIIGIILGSFFDLQLSTAIASPTSGLGLTISAICPTIGFAVVALMGGGFVVFGLRKEYHIALRIMFFVFAAACLGVSIYYPAGEYFGINGFYGAAPKWVGYLIVIVPECGAMVGGYFLFRNCTNKNMWIVFLTMVGLLLIALLAVLPMIKDNMHRPRYRFLMNDNQDMFHNWYEPFKEYKDYIAAHPNEPHDNFKSFPSGHTAETCILFVGITLFPLADKKLEKYQLPAFICASVLTLVLMFARILAAAHFLSDVSFGATIMLTLLIATNEVIMRIKALQLPEEAPVEEPVQE